MGRDEVWEGVEGEGRKGAIWWGCEGGEREEGAWRASAGEFLGWLEKKRKKKWVSGGCFDWKPIDWVDQVAGKFRERVNKIRQLCRGEEGRGRGRGEDG